jgi:hypothetical protein
MTQFWRWQREPHNDEAGVLLLVVCVVVWTGLLVYCICTDRDVRVAKRGATSQSLESV